MTLVLKRNLNLRNSPNANEGEIAHDKNKNNENKEIKFMN